MASPKKFKSVFSANFEPSAPAEPKPTGTKTSQRGNKGRQATGNGSRVVVESATVTSYATTSESQVVNNYAADSPSDDSDGGPATPVNGAMGPLPLPSNTSSSTATGAARVPRAAAKPKAVTGANAAADKKRKVPMKDRPRRPDGKLLPMNDDPYVDRRSRNAEPIDQILSCINPPPGGTRAYVVFFKGSGQRTLTEDEVKKSSPRVLREWKRLQY